MLEEKYGSKIFAIMITITAVASGLFYVIFFPEAALLGASGIVFMMIVLSSAAGMQNGRIPITLLLVVIIYLGGELLNGLSVTDGIAQAAHIIGGLCGVGFGFLMVRKNV
jgi:membrane associated rhomboid family serine protease